jgi:hypothetical protein
MPYLPSNACRRPAVVCPGPADGKNVPGYRVWPSGIADSI